MIDEYAKDHMLNKNLKGDILEKVKKVLWLK